MPKKFMLSAHGPKKSKLAYVRTKMAIFEPTMAISVFECILPILRVIMPKRPDSGLKNAISTWFGGFLSWGERSRLWGRGRKKSKEGYPHAPHAP